MKKIYGVIMVSLLLTPIFLFSQNEGQKWFFGHNAGLDFSTNPPTFITGALRADEGTACISDGSGNLLFYTDGVTVYNQINVVMANGTGLMGNGSTTQSALIVKKPASTSIYYIFTLDQLAGAGGLNYSEVDMSLAAGMGSVTAKNNPLYTPSCEKMIAVTHCNGIDTWVVTHDFSSSGFRSYLVTAAGVSLTPVLSVSGSTISGNNQKAIGQMKASPNGNKIGLTVYDGNSGPVELHDFNIFTGMVSNLLLLGNFNSNYGCEFSPDGSKFYSARANFSQIFQWDLCAGNSAAIIASQSTITTNAYTIGEFQAAPNGKIYIARAYVPYISVINFPNTAGQACNFVDTAISLGPDTCELGLPNFPNGFFKLAATPAPFTYTASCNTYSFDAPATTTANGCNAISSVLTGYLWDFGDPASGAANSSTLSNPSHAYAAVNNYTAQLVRYYTCSSDTVRATLLPTTASPNLSVTGTFTICKGDKRVFTVAGASSYTWSNAANAPTLALSPIITTTYSVAGTGSNACTASNLFTVTVNICTGLNAAGEDEAVFKLYPNPNNGSFYIESKAPAVLNVLDQFGQDLFQGSFESGKSSIDLSFLNKGIYIVGVTNGTGTQILRLVKME